MSMPADQAVMEIRGRPTCGPGQRFLIEVPERFAVARCPRAVRKNQCRETPDFGGGNPPRIPEFSVGVSHTTVPVGETPTTSRISGSSSPSERARSVDGMVDQGGRVHRHDAPVRAEPRNPRLRPGAEEGARGFRGLRLLQAQPTHEDDVEVTLVTSAFHRSRARMAITTLA